ncbi:Serine acetyltransferase 4 [Capsicum annuum]|nr:Serine acetyltransferase 4 [Capsicum annuum]
MQEALKQTTRELRRQLKFVPPRPLGVTLGGTGKETSERHPKIGQGALIRASVTILGNIKVGEGAMVGADSLVMKDVPPHSTVTGIPAKVIGYVDDQDSSLTMKHDASKNFFLKVAISCKEARFNALGFSGICPSTRSFHLCSKSLTLALPCRIIDMDPVKGSEF